MSTWNHRVIKHSEEQIAVHEVYYDDEGEIWAWVDSPTEVDGNNFEDLKKHYEQMASAFTKPVLNVEDMPGFGENPPTEMDLDGPDES